MPLMKETAQKSNIILGKNIIRVLFSNICQNQLGTECDSTEHLKTCFLSNSCQYTDGFHFHQLKWHLRLKFGDEITSNVWNALKTYAVI